MGLGKRPSLSASGKARQRKLIESLKITDSYGRGRGEEVLCRIDFHRNVGWKYDFYVLDWMDRFFFNLILKKEIVC